MDAVEPQGFLWNAEEYHQYSLQQQIVAEKLLEQFAFNDGDHVLDIGCGDGKITASIAKKIPNGCIVGLDPSDSMIDFANSNIEQPRLSFVLGKASELKYCRQFDVITSFSALHWEPNQKDALFCFRRALKPGGAILLAIPGPDFGLRRALEGVCHSGKWAQYFDRFESPGYVWTPNEYAQLLLETGFIIRKVELVDRTHVFQRIEDYQGFIGSMLPHMSCLPKAKKQEFLSDLTHYLRIIGVIDERHRAAFQVKVLEIIAYSPTEKN